MDHLVFGRWFPSDQEKTQVLRLLRRSSLGVWLSRMLTTFFLQGGNTNIDAITKALLAKYVMKKSGSFPYEKSEEVMNNVSEGIDFLGARITRDDDGTVWCDQTKYILHCMKENKFINEEGQVVLKRAHAPPAVDEKLGEEEGTVREK